MKDKILIYDIETSYTVGAVWGLYEQNIAAVIREPYMLSFAWKWLGEKTTHVLSLPDFSLYKKDQHNDKELVKALWGLFNEANIIIAHNGNSFDQKWSYARFIVNGLEPPQPAQYIDTKVIAKNKFKFNSNSLNNLGKYFDIGQKIDTGGIGLWVDCIEKKDPKAWALMCKYNKQDVVLLEQVYLKLRPYITNHPNLNVFNGTFHSCPNCSSSNTTKRGTRPTRTGRKQAYQCNDCGSWHQGETIKMLEKVIS